MVEYEWIGKEYFVWMKWLMALDGEECQLCMLECVNMCICAIWVMAECPNQGGREKCLLDVVVAY